MEPAAPGPKVGEAVGEAVGAAVGAAVGEAVRTVVTTSTPEATTDPYDANVVDVNMVLGALDRLEANVAAAPAAEVEDSNITDDWTCTLPAEIQLITTVCPPADDAIWATKAWRKDALKAASSNKLMSKAEKDTVEDTMS